MLFQHQYRITVLIFACLMITGCFGVESSTKTNPPTANAADDYIEGVKLGSTKNVHQCGDIVFAGQFEEADIPTLKEAGITQVISLRKDGELDWDEAKAVEDAGLKHATVAFRTADELTDEKITELRELLGNTDGKTMLHCGGAGRVAAVWITHRVLDDGVEMDKAIEEAKTIGLKSEPLKERAIEYIEKEQKKQSEKE